MRIVTHTDLDGLISAYLICKKFDIEKPDVITAEPGEVQTGSIKFQKDDVVCDLPQPRDKKLKPIKVKLWFDHHIDSEIKEGQEGKYDSKAKSCAQVIVDHFKIDVDKDMIAQVNRIDSADFTREDIDRENTGYFLSWAIKTKDEDMDLHFFKHTLDRLINQDYKDVLDDVIMFRANFKIKKMKESRKRIEKILKVNGELAILDMRSEVSPKFFDRFYPFVLKPEVEFLIRIHRGPLKKVRVGLSRSPFFKTKTKVSVQELVKLFGGGGHKGAGGFDSTYDKVSKDVDELVFQLGERLRK